MATKTLSVVIAGDAKGAQSAFQKVGSDADGLTGKLSGLGAKISPGMAAAAGAMVAGVGLMVRGAWQAAEESAKISRETERVIKTTGASAWTSADQVSEYAGELSNLTGVDDEVIQSGENLLLTFTNVQNKLGQGNDVFDRASAAALDMATVMGTDMSSAAVMVGKALNDPRDGLTKLTRAGVTFTDQQKEQIRTLTESGDVLGAQKIILGELEKEFGGAAAAAATPLDKLKVQVGNLQEQFGAFLIPIAAEAAQKLSGLVAAFTALPGPMQAAIGGAAAFGTAIAGGIVVVAKLADVMSPVMGVAKKAMDAAAMSTATLANKMGASADTALKMGQNLGQALGAAGIAVGGIITALAIYNAKVHEVDDTLKSWTATIKDKTAGMSMSELGDYIGKVRDQAAGLNDQIANSHAPWDKDFRDQLRLGRDELNNNADALQALSEKANTLSAASGTSADAALRWLQQEQAAGRTYSTNEALLAAYTGQTASYAYTAKDAGFAAQSQADGIRDVIDATKAAVDPYFAALDATQKLKDAQVTAFLTAKQYGDQAPETKAANEAVARSAMQTEGSYLALAAQMKANGSTSDDMKAAFQRWVEQGALTQAQADQLVFQFGLLGAKADEVGRKNVAIPVSTPGMDSALANFNALIARLDTINSRGVARVQAIIAAGGIPGENMYADGGSVGDGWFTVGEQGPELGYKSGSSVEIFSNGQSGRMLSGGGGNTYITNHVHMPVGANGDDVVEALKRYERRNGAGWRN